MGNFCVIALEFLVLLAAVATSTLRSGTNLKSVSPSEYLKNNATKIKFGELQTDDGFEDLSDLKRAIGDSRIVMLGESAHGAGSTNALKGRIAAFLHEKMSFDYVAFESGMHACIYGEDNLRRGLSGISSFQQCVFGIWSHAQQVRSFMNYVADTRKSSSPMHLIGFDTQFPTGNLPGSQVSDDLRALLKEYNSSLADDQHPWCAEIDEFFGLLRKALRNEPPAPLDHPDLPAHNQTRFFVWLQRMQLEVNRLLEKNGGIEEFCSPSAKFSLERCYSPMSLSFWQQMLKSVENEFRQYWQGMEFGPAGTKDENIYGSAGNNYRDRGMGSNLAWLARNLRNNDGSPAKIAVWVHSFHMLRNFDQVEWVDLPHTYPQEWRKPNTPFVGMGNYFAHFFAAAGGVAESDVYNCHFTSFNGSYFFGQGISTFPPAPKGSFARYFADAGFSLGFVDLHLSETDRAAKWMTQPQIARPDFYSYSLRGVYTSMTDGIVFIRQQEPNKYMTSIDTAWYAPF